jgi:hypothetical protein
MIEKIDICVKTIQLRPPSASSGNKRSALSGDADLDIYISMESFLRRFAYRNTTILTGESFFDDSDMISTYNLIIVYERNTNTPLLTARYYFDKAVIEKYLKGDVSGDIQPQNKNSINFNDFKDGNIFLADRLSGNISSNLYRKNRAHIFESFYSEIQNNHKNCTIILMVRSEKHEKQLSKYLKLGFAVKGSALHRGKKHWIILAGLNKA